MVHNLGNHRLYHELQRGTHRGKMVNYHFVTYYMFFVYFMFLAELVSSKPCFGMTHNTNKSDS